MRRALLLLLSVLTACTPERPWAILEQALESGRNVADVAKGDPAVVLLLAPDDVFTCGNHIDRRVEWSRRTGGALHFVFTRTPTDVESRQLQIMRIPPPEILASHRGAPYGSREYLVLGGKVRYAMDVRAGQLGSVLLDHANGGRLADLAR